MSLKSPLVFLICLSIGAAIWLAASSRRPTETALASAAVISLLCTAVVLLRPHNTAPREEVAEEPATPKEPDESAEFRRGVFDLCAALKLGIRLCEERLHSEPDSLIEELERMKDNISAFVNDVAHPVRFDSRKRWPWRMTPRPRRQH
jgi:hypothetical protein